MAKNNSKNTPVSERQHKTSVTTVEDGNLVIATRPVSVVKIEFKKLAK